MIPTFSKFYGKIWVCFCLNTGKRIFLEVSNTLTLKQIFWKTKTFFKKLEYYFLHESTKIENASFPYKTVMSEANVQTNRMEGTKWTYHKERSFASNCFFLKKVLFQCKKLLQRVDLMYQQPSCPYS